MPMKNKVKELIDSQGISIYEFRKRTGIANRTAYDLYHNSGQYPGPGVMDKICEAFNVQPGDILEYVKEPS